MATGVESEKGERALEWKQIRKEITCKNCGELFTEPKTIPCLHTFCKRCLEKSPLVATNNLTYCPVCRKTFSCELMAVPTNRMISRVVEVFKQKEAGELVCDNCSDQGNSAAYWCVECNSSMCETCNDAHSRLKTFSSHKTITMVEFWHTPYTYLSTEETKHCGRHTKQSLDLYCKTCHTTICRDCTVKDHPQETHKFEFIDEVVSEEKVKLKDMMRSLEESLKQMRIRIKDTEECEKQLDVKHKESHQEIKAAYHEVRKLLKQQKEKALQQLETSWTSLKRTLALQKETCELLESQMVTCREFSNSMVDVNKTEQFLTYSDWVFERAGCLTKQLEHINNDSTKSMTITCTKPAEYVTPLCSVTPDVPLCTICNIIIKSNGIKVIMALTDLHGSPVLNQMNNIKIHCSMESECLSVEVVEQKGGVYHIWYPLERTESHVMSVYCNRLVVKREEIRVPETVRDYTNINQEVMVIDKYGPTSDKPLKFPHQFAKGPKDEVIINDDATNQLVVFDRQLKFSRVIGGQDTTGNERLQGITGVAVDKEGYLYVADCKLNCIKKFTLLDGQFVSQFGSEGVNEGQFRSPFGLLLTTSQLLFVCDRHNDRVQVFKNEQFSYSFGKYGKEPGRLHEPIHLAVNTNEDKIFVTDFKNHRVQVFTLNGDFLQSFGTFPDTVELKNPTGIFYTPDGHVLVSSYSTDKVLVFEADGSYVSAIEGTYQGEARFTSPCGVMMRGNGQIVIACNDGAYGNRLVLF